MIRWYVVERIRYGPGARSRVANVMRVPNEEAARKLADDLNNDQDQSILAVLSLDRGSYLMRYTAMWAGPPVTINIHTPLFLEDERN